MEIPDTIEELEDVTSDADIMMAYELTGLIELLIKKKVIQEKELANIVTKKMIQLKREVIKNRDKINKLLKQEEDGGSYIG